MRKAKSSDVCTRGYKKMVNLQSSTLKFTTKRGRFAPADENSGVTKERYELNGYIYKRKSK